MIYVANWILLSCYFVADLNMNHAVDPQANELQDSVNSQSVCKQIELAEQYKCSRCQKSFSLQCQLDHHTAVCDAGTKMRLYKCVHCEQMFLSNEKLKFHMMHRHMEEKVHHTKLRLFKCASCKEIFLSDNKLRFHTRHMHTGKRMHHTKLRLYKCVLCKEVFLSNKKLRVHMKRLHTGKKPYKCNMCWRRFQMKVHLDSHLRVCLGKKPKCISSFNTTFDTHFTSFQCG